MPSRREVIAGLAVTLGVTGCARDERASTRDIMAARFVPSDGAYVEIMTMVNRKQEKGAHTGLLVNASQRVIYDPAGTFSHPDLPESGDVHFGVTDRHVDYYKRYHARFSHYVHSQKVLLSAAAAEQILQRTIDQGSSPKMFCTVNTTQILRPVPPFSGVGVTLFPERLRKDVARIPGVIDSYTVEDDEDKVLPTA